MREIQRHNFAGKILALILMTLFLTATYIIPAFAETDTYNDAKYNNLQKMQRVKRGVYICPNEVINVAMHNKGNYFYVLHLPKDNKKDNNVKKLVVRWKDYELKDHISPLDLSMGAFNPLDGEYYQVYESLAYHWRIDYTEPYYSRIEANDVISHLREGIKPRIFLLTDAYYDQSADDVPPDVNIVMADGKDPVKDDSYAYDSISHEDMINRYYEYGRSIGKPFRGDPYYEEQNDNGERTGSEELGKNEDGTTAVTATIPMLCKQKKNISGKFDMTPNKFKVSDKKLASVNKKGILKAKNKAGTVTITGYLKEGKELTCVGTYTITIEKAQMEKKINMTSVNESVSANNLLSGTTLKPTEWVSTKPSVATVDETGNIIPVGKGTTKIYPVFGSYKAKNIRSRISVKLSK